MRLSIQTLLPHWFARSPKLRSTNDIRHLAGVPVLVRAALNVPLRTGKVSNDYRLERALPTLQYLMKRGARVVVISHLGEHGTETLRPVAEALGRFLPGVSFHDEAIGASARAAVRQLAPGRVLVLENLRRHRGERKNDRAFAEELASLGDVFVQDSFDTCHRPHASIIGVPKLLPSYAGIALLEELAALSRSREAEAPSLAIIGGMKFETKERVLSTLLARYTHVFVGGALANDFLKVLGYPVGKSLISPAPSPMIETLAHHPNILLPTDVRVYRNSTEHTDILVVNRGKVEPNDIIVDHGPSTVAVLAKHIREARTVLWNGPLGKYEDGCVDATAAIAKAISASHAHSVLGGGDTVAAVSDLGLLPAFSFVSTGGGAMLEYLVKGTLPGIDALR